MRKWGYLKKEYYVNKTDIVYKIMIHEMKKCTFVYLYCSKDVVMCSYDYCYPNLENALEDWDCEVDLEGWHMIDDPALNCPRDYIESTRMKGSVKDNLQ